MKSYRYFVASLSCVVLVTFFFSTHETMAQSIERQVSYQGLLTQQPGAPLADGTYGIVLRLYDAETGGNLVYEEQQQVTLVRGLFNVLIGSTASLAGVDFTQQLWLETALEGQQPFIPRTRFAVVPYAIHAETADVARKLDDDAEGFVRSLNGAQGDLVIVGDGLTVTREGDTISLNVTISGSQVEELVSSDLTINIENPNGPVTDIGLADSSVTQDKLADGAVTTSKIADESVTVQKLEAGIIPTSLPPSGPAGGDLTGTYPDPLIRGDAITSDKILNGQVKNQDLDNNSVTTLKLVDAAVTSQKLANSSVTNQKLGNSSVSTSKLIDESVTDQKLSRTGVSPGMYGSGVLVPRIQVDDRGRLVSVEQVSIPDIQYTGPAGGDLTGTYPNPRVAPGAINNSKIADGAVDTRVLSDNSVTGGKIVDGTIQAVDIAPGVIPTTLPPSGPAGGVLAGAYPDPTINVAEGQQLLGAINNSATSTINDDLLNTTGVTVGTYGDGANGLVPRVTIDKYGRVTSAIEEQILSARPTGSAGGDLQGAYPNPLINPTAAAGGRVVDAVRADYLGGDPDINSPNNLVVLDRSNRYPSGDGSLITNVDASNISQGVLPIERGGTNSSQSIQNNRIMISSGGKIIESAPLAAQNILIGSGSTSLPTPGTISAGNGINVTFSSPNFVISNTNAKLLPGGTNDQTLRWDGTFAQWIPNSKLLATAAGDVTAEGNVQVDGTLDVYGATTVGSKDNTINSVGPGANTTNTIGSSTATNYIYGSTFINDNTSANTSIGNLSSPTSGTTINVGDNGNLQLNGIDDGEPFKFLSVNTNNDVRSSAASGLALEGLMWQDGAFRLGGTDGTINPLQQDRYVNLENNSLYISRLAGASNMVRVDGGSNTITVEATTNVNTIGATLTTIGNPVSRTTIGGQLDPRGDITNDEGNVVIRDQTEIVGPTFINIGTNDYVQIGNGVGANSNIGIGTSAAATHLLTINGVPQTNASVDPNIFIVHLGGQAFNSTVYTDDADNGVVTANGSGELFKWDESVFLNSFAWRTIGNTITNGNNILGTLNDVGIDIRTNDVTHFILDENGALTQSVSAGNVTLTGVLAAGNQGNTMGDGAAVRQFTVFGQPDALIGQTIADNPSVWDAVIQGDAAIAGIVKLGGSVWIDGVSPTHSLVSDQAFELGTSTESSLVFFTNDTPALTIDGTDQSVKIHGTLSADTLSTESLIVIGDSDEHVALIENTNSLYGDGLLIKLGRKNDIRRLQATADSVQSAVDSINNLIYGNLRNHIEGVIKGDNTPVSIDDFIPKTLIKNAVGGITNSAVNWINDKLGLKWEIPSDTVDFIFGKIGPGDLFTVGKIPTVPDVVDPWQLPNLDNVFAALYATDYLDRRNHFITFQDTDGFQAGAIKAESMKDWAENVLLSPALIVKIASNFVGVDPLKAVAKSTGDLAGVLYTLTKIGVVYQSGNGDYAEWLERSDHSERITAGDVVGVRAGKISRDLAGAEQIMVVSHNPIVRGNSPDAKREQVGNDVAFVGQVPVKVMGVVESGDYIVASETIPGWAVAKHANEMETNDYARAVGRSWDTHSEEGPKFVNTVIGIHNNNWVQKVQEIEREQQRNSARIDQLESTLQRTLGIEIKKGDDKTQP